METFKGSGGSREGGEFKRLGFGGGWRITRGFEASGSRAKP